MKKLITIYNIKGGVGKTSIANIISKELECNIYTNDTESFLYKKTNDNKTLISAVLEDDKNKNYVIADLGGFINKESQLILDSSDLLLIPLNIDLDSITRALQVAKYHKGYYKFIINNYGNKKEQNSIIDLLEELGIKKDKCLSIKHSKLLEHSLYKQKNIKGILEDNNNQFKKHYEEVIEQINTITNYIKGKKWD